MEHHGNGRDRSGGTDRDRRGIGIGRRPAGSFGGYGRARTTKRLRTAHPDRRGERECPIHANRPKPVTRHVDLLLKTSEKIPACRPPPIRPLSNFTSFAVVYHTKPLQASLFYLTPVLFACFICLMTPHE